MHPESVSLVQKQYKLSKWDHKRFQDFFFFNCYHWCDHQWLERGVLRRRLEASSQQQSIWSFDCTPTESQQGWVQSSYG